MSKPVPVLFLYPTLDVGGAERQVEALVHGLDPRLFRPIVAVQHRIGRVGEDLVAAGVPVHALSDARRFDPAFLPRTRRLMRNEGVRLVMTHGFSTGVVARLAALFGGPPVRVLAEHTTDELDMTAAKHLVNRGLAPWTTAWVAVSESQVAYLTGVKRVPRARLHVIANGIDVQRYGGDRGGARARIRAEWGIPEQAPVAGCVAVLRPEKDLVTLVHAADALVRELPTARVVIVGDGPERITLRQEVLAGGLEDVVTLAGFRDDIADVLSAFDVAVLCSRVEALPVAFLEAMASGLPLVGTRVGALVDLVEPERNGLLVPPGDAEALAQAMARTLGDRDSARRWGDESCRRVKAHYGLGTMVRAYEQLFIDLLRRAGVALPDLPSTTFET